MRAIKHILLAVKDPSAPSTAAINKAIQLASALGASLELFHSITTHVYMGFDLEIEDLEDLKKSRLRQQHARLETLAKRRRLSGIAGGAVPLADAFTKDLQHSSRLSGYRSKPQ